MTTSGGSTGSGGGSALPQRGAAGSIRIDGSSTVQPVRRGRGRALRRGAARRQDDGRRCWHGGRVRALLRRRDPDLRRLAPDQGRREGPACEKAGIKFGEVQIANDGIAVIANKDLQGRLRHDRAAQEAAGTEVEGRQLQRARRRAAPTKRVVLHAWHGVGHLRLLHRRSTLETDAEERTTRYQTSADDNQIITGVSGTRARLGYVGFSYAEERRTSSRSSAWTPAMVASSPEQGDDPGRLLQAALAPAVHVPEPDRAREARDQGLHGLRRSTTTEDRRGRRRSCR